MSIDYRHLSKTIAHALRHQPAQYGLDLDAEGWVPVDELLAALRRKRDWHSLTLNDLMDMMVHAEKQRYELRDGKIRAFYGHSTPDRVQRSPAIPPDFLFHGTAPEAARIIREEGLKPMNRQYVHLSADEATARLVGTRHASEPVILRILARDAHVAGIVFYLGNENVWLADCVPPQFIRTP